MTETAGSVVRDALTELTVQADEQSMDASELFTGVRYLNRMMAAYDADGIKLGYTRVDSPNDLLTIPAGAIEGVVFNLAVRLAPQYDMPVSQTLAVSADNGLRTLETLGFDVGKVAFPSTLPVGSGNENFSGIYSGAQFYPDCCEDENPCGTSTNNGDSNGL